MGVEIFDPHIRDIPNMWTSNSFIKRITKSIAKGTYSNTCLKSDGISI